MVRAWASPRFRSGVLAAGWFTLGFIVWAFTTGWVRGSIGDLAVVAFIAHLAGVLVPVHVVFRAIAALVFAWSVELLQTLDLVGPDSPEWMHILLGSTYDPEDLFWYTVSAVLAVVLELAVRRTGAQEP